MQSEHETMSTFIKKHIALFVTVAGASVGGTVTANSFLTMKRVAEFFRITPILLQRQIEHRVIGLAGNLLHNVEEFW